MPPLDLLQLAVGTRVQHELLVLERAERSKSDGDPYVVLRLGNASGSIETAPIWAEQLAWAEGAERGAVVQATGHVSVYGRNGHSKRQLTLTAPLRVLPAAKVRAEDFLPRIAGDCTRLWDWVDRTRAEVQSARLRRVLELFFCDDEFRLRFERTPGSVSGHHAKLGGLLLHVYEVTSIARTAARTTRANLDLVVAGALLHDVGKVEAYEIGPAGFEYTPCGLLLGHVVLGCLMLQRRVADAALRGDPVCSDGQLLELEHLVVSHHGALEFGSPVQPMTVEAEILHWADETSARARDMIDALDDAEAFAAGGEFSDRKLWRVGRRVWRRPHGWD
jgi:3'-5' exoribonuclease